MASGMANPLTMILKLCIRDKVSSRLVPDRPLIAEGVGLEPTSPCGQRFSSPRTSSVARPLAPYPLPPRSGNNSIHPPSSLQSLKKEWQQNGKSLDEHAL